MKTQVNEQLSTQNPKATAMKQRLFVMNTAIRPCSETLPINIQFTFRSIVVYCLQLLNGSTNLLCYTWPQRERNFTMKRNNFSCIKSSVQFAKNRTVPFAILPQRIRRNTVYTWSLNSKIDSFLKTLTVICKACLKISRSK